MRTFLATVSLFVGLMLSMGSNCDDAPMCIANDGAECNVGQDQCGCDLVCFDLGYGFGHCGEPLVDGVGCWNHDECQSGQCIQGICGGPQVDEPQDPPACDDGCCDPEGCPEVCAPVGVSCALGCCAGLVCTDDLCAHPARAPGPDGTPCESAAQCESGVCTAGTCGVIDDGTCAVLGEPCGEQGCCAGATCNWWDNVYVMEASICVPQHDDGAGCFSDDQCLSGACVDGVCAAPACQAVDSACDEDRPCCAGSFCQQWANPYELDPHACVAQVADGESCWEDQQCLTGDCVGNVCGQLCVPDEGWCEAGVDPCCEGACHDLGYGWGNCGPRLEAGAYCTSADECLSGVCAAFACE